MYTDLIYLGVGWSIAHLLSWFIHRSGGGWLLIYLFGQSIWPTHAFPSPVFSCACWPICFFVQIASLPNNAPSQVECKHQMCANNTMLFCKCMYIVGCVHFSFNYLIYKSRVGFVYNPFSHIFFLYPTTQYFLNLDFTIESGFLCSCYMLYRCTYLGVL